jgi:hypothetical protein
MPITKWFCIVLGSLMIFLAVAAGPRGYAVSHHAMNAVGEVADSLIQDGSITINSKVLLAKHPANFPEMADAREEFGRQFARAVSRSVWDDMHLDGYITFCMGAAWLVVGVRIGRYRPRHPALPPEPAAAQSVTSP